MNTMKIELPDGRALRIEGGDAESTAKLIANHYIGQAPVEPIAGAVGENPMDMPVMIFDERYKQTESGGEEPLPTPVMNFGFEQERIDGSPSDPQHGPGVDEEPLEVPVMNFRR